MADRQLLAKAIAKATKEFNQEFKSPKTGPTYEGGLTTTLRMLEKQSDDWLRQYIQNSAFVNASSVVEEGRAAFLSGAKKADNPYWQNPTKKREWESGWNEAKQYPGRGFSKIDGKPYANGRTKAETYLNQKMAEVGVKVENAKFTRSSIVPDKAAGGYIVRGTDPLIRILAPNSPGNQGTWAVWRSGSIVQRFPPGEGGPAYDYALGLANSAQVSNAMDPRAAQVEFNFGVKAAKDGRPRSPSPGLGLEAKTHWLAGYDSAQKAKDQAKRDSEDWHEEQRLRRGRR